MAILWDALIAGWKFEESSGSRVDVLGSRTLTQTGTVTATTGIIGNAATGFSASNYLSHASPIWSGGLLSGSVWFNRSSNATAYIFQSASDFYLRYEAGRSNQVQLVMGSVVSYTVSPALDTWHHVAFTFDEIDVKVYYDGVYRATIAQSPVTPLPSALKVGVNSGAGSPWAGHLDSLYFFSDVLSDGGVSLNATAGGDIASLYNAGAGLDFPSGPPVGSRSLLGVGK